MPPSNKAQQAINDTIAPDAATANIQKLQQWMTMISTIPFSAEKPRATLPGYGQGMKTEDVGRAIDCAYGTSTGTGTGERGIERRPLRDSRRQVIPRIPHGRQPRGTSTARRGGQQNDGGGRGISMVLRPRALRDAAPLGRGAGSASDREQHVNGKRKLSAYQQRDSCDGAGKKQRRMDWGGKDGKDGKGKGKGGRRLNCGE